MPAALRAQHAAQLVLLPWVHQIGLLLVAFSKT